MVSLGRRGMTSARCRSESAINARYVAASLTKTAMHSTQHQATAGQHRGPAGSKAFVRISVLWASFPGAHVASMPCVIETSARYLFPFACSKCCYSSKTGAILKEDGTWMRPAAAFQSTRTRRCGRQRGDKRSRALSRLRSRCGPQKHFRARELDDAGGSGAQQNVGPLCDQVAIHT